MVNSLYFLDIPAHIRTPIDYDWIEDLSAKLCKSPCFGLRPPEDERPQSVVLRRSKLNYPHYFCGAIGGIFRRDLWDILAPYALDVVVGTCQLKNGQLLDDYVLCTVRSGSRVPSRIALNENLVRCPTCGAINSDSDQPRLHPVQYHFKRADITPNCHFLKGAGLGFFVTSHLRELLASRFPEGVLHFVPYAIID